jgi:hypothetical protein
MVAVVPKEMEALSGVITERPRVSQPLSEPVDISGRPSGTPVSSENSRVILPTVLPDGMSSHSFSRGMSQKQRVRSLSPIHRRFL